MNKRDTKKYEKLLLAELEHLSTGIKKIEKNALQDYAGENTVDPMDFAEAGTDSFDRDTALNIASGESKWLRKVNDALLRIKEGTYGVCEGCESDIPKKRLEVFPSARFCVECQSRLEKEGVL